MLLKRDGLPEVGEIVVCKVVKITPYSTFVEIEEYGGKQGLIHISEIKQGRIRNLRDYVQEGKIIVCKVLNSDPKKQHIDLSLRRVTEREKREKLIERKLEQTSEKLLLQFAEKHGLDGKELFNKIWKKVSDKYDYLFELFQDIVEGNFDITKLGLDKKLAKELKETVINKIKPKEVEKKIFFSLTNTSSEGLFKVKDILTKAIENFKDKVSITYAGGGKYLLVAKEKDYKVLEGMIKAIRENIEKLADKNTVFNFDIRVEK